MKKYSKKAISIDQNLTLQSLLSKLDLPERTVTIILQFGLKHIIVLCSLKRTPHQCIPALTTIYPGIDYGEGECYAPVVPYLDSLKSLFMEFQVSHLYVIL